MTLFNPKPGYLSHFPPPVAFSRVAASATGVSVVSEEIEGDLDPYVLESHWRYHGDTYAFGRAGRLNLFFGHPDDVQAVLVNNSKDFGKGEQEQALAAAVGWGLLTHEGATHKQIQNSLRPSVRGEILNKYLTEASQLSSTRIAGLRGQEISLVEVSREFSQDVSEVTLFGLAEPTEAYEYHRAVWAQNLFMQSQISSISDGSELRASLEDFRNNKALVDQHVNDLIHLWKKMVAPPETF